MNEAFYEFLTDYGKAKDGEAKLPYLSGYKTGCLSL